MHLRPLLIVIGTQRYNLADYAGLEGCKDKDPVTLLLRR